MVTNKPYIGSDYIDICFRAARICLNRNIPFALTFLPGSDVPLFAASKSVPERTALLSECDDGFILNTFASDIKFPLYIRPEIAPEQIVGSDGFCVEGIAGNVEIWESSTNKEDYIRRVSALIARLAKNGGKTVISRVVCGKASSIDWIAVARELFMKFGSAYRFLYYTPQTGAWIGASPESLLLYDGSARMLSTMSLAGTRKYDDTNKRWDIKNIREHVFVTDYILSCLRSFGLNPEVGAAENLRYGIIEHLCHRINVCGVSPDSVFDIIGRMSPTPALAGYPLEDALSHISEVEDFPRICYGGYIGNVINGNLHCYVNLRCAHIQAGRFCLFAGGGITADSQAGDEWEETAFKCSALLEIIENSSK